MPDFLLLRLEGPLLAFGGETVDARGVIVDFPGRSTLTGLFANALGWRRTEHDRHARLQERLVFGARIDREGRRLTDFQTAELNASQEAWTTSGRRFQRGGGSLGTTIRERDFHADAAVTVALTLEPADEVPKLTELAGALDEPARPLFIGRKTCLPAGRLSLGVRSAPDLTGALLAEPLAEGVRGERGSDTVRLMLPSIEVQHVQDEIRYVTDERNWRSGVHGGARRLRYRTVPIGSITDKTP